LSSDSVTVQGDGPPHSTARPDRPDELFPEFLSAADFACNLKAAIVAAEEVFEARGLRLPVMISVTVTDKSGRTLSGHTIDAFWVSIAHARPFSVGINCARGARDMRPYLAELAGIADCYISCHPNAGLPNAFGAYDEQPNDTGSYLREFAESGFVNIVGGCCGTTPEHIAAIARGVAGLHELSTTEDTKDTEEVKTQIFLVSSVSLWWKVHPPGPRDAYDPPRLELDDRRWTNVTGSERFCALIRGEHNGGDPGGPRSGGAVART
jgi:hypothetical protein